MDASISVMQEEFVSYRKLDRNIRIDKWVSVFISIKVNMSVQYL